MAEKNTDHRALLSQLQALRDSVPKREDTRVSIYEELRLTLLAIETTLDTVRRLSFSVRILNPLLVDFTNLH